MGTDEYFMAITEIVAMRTTCTRRAVGAVLVKDKHILTTGYNGSPKGLQHCLDIGCLRDRLGIAAGERHELCRGVHAEQNAIVQSAVFGIPIKGATVYTTLHPCVICTKLLINAGVERIVYMEGYPDDLSKALLDEAGIEVVRYEGPRHRTTRITPEGVEVDDGVTLRYDYGGRSGPIAED
ncbi:MAG: dCMP deaminase family protein [Thermoplasmata archaeon]|nr:dCMP deaminase family protein [Thermoplasmata archaeon]